MVSTVVAKLDADAALRFFVRFFALTDVISHFFKFNCTPDRIRTCDRLLRRQMLYPTELRAHSDYLLLRTLGLLFALFLD